jgi:hypothetical protein
LLPVTQPGRLIFVTNLKLELFSEHPLHECTEGRMKKIQTASNEEVCGAKCHNLQLDEHQEYNKL